MRILRGIILTIIWAQHLHAKPMNIVWIVIEDASPDIGCYGETAIKTPNMDQMAEDGIRFTHAFVTSPVCSPSRSAMISGMYPVTLGAHNHSSQNTGGKGKGGPAYHKSYRVPVKLVPELFRDAGYFVTNNGKTDYNFIPPRGLYDGSSWKKAKNDQPIFAQFQLRGGKNREAPGHCDPAAVQLPPYYPEHPVIRQDWAKYLDSWVQTDKEVGQILAALEAAGRLDSTAVFLWTDHGVSHLRGKQFLYEEGIRIPLIISLPDKQKAGSLRNDIIEHIDIAATSLALAGIEIPDYVRGRDFLAADHVPRDHLFAARDRCDETVDIIRAVRDERFKYIRNFMSHVPHAQPNRYKDKKIIVQTIRELNAKGKLNELQARPFACHRPPEELYDLEEDPNETTNLATDPNHLDRLLAMRELTYSRMLKERDMGLIPEPILEDLGRKAGTKYDAFLKTNHNKQTKLLVEVITAGEANDTNSLMAFTESKDPSARYWAAVWLGVNKTPDAKTVLKKLLTDETPAVKLAAAQSLVKLGDKEYLKLLIHQINDPNYLLGMYALRAIEELGDEGKAYKQEISAAQNSPYEFSRRIATRLMNRWAEN
ncbi:sulfatase-like hydrolase/transferase [Haloferula sp.]|uniref:sulfatase-like hydrolase/transferase n=1 Tax=Haloferula sp. TaxID=2497595 RepID=UPI003C71C4D0